MRLHLWLYSWSCALLFLFASLAPSFAAEFKNFDEAMREGMKQVREKQFPEAQVALEAALKLAANDEDRAKAYQGLIQPYRQLLEIDKMLEAQDFIIAHSDQKARRSLAASDVASFLHQRGKDNVGIARYEARLQKDPRDLIALNMLAVLYRNSDKHRDQAEAMKQRVESVNIELAQKLAEKHEATAAAASTTKAWYYKEAALAWLEANEKLKAHAAARKSAASPPEARSGVLAYFWHEGLGRAFLAVGDGKSAIPQFEAAMELAPGKGQRDEAEKKLAEAKALDK